MTDGDHANDSFDEPIPERSQLWKRITMGIVLFILIGFTIAQVVGPVSQQLPSPNQATSALPADKYKEFIAHYEKGRAAFAQDNYALAKQEFGLAIQVDPTYKVGYLARISCDYRLNDWKSIVDDETQLIAIDPKDAEAYQMR
ncbi:MAG: hypothetical protein ACRD3W_10725, partial [Terriglobales bacterium]